MGLSLAAVAGAYAQNDGGGAIAVLSAGGLFGQGAHGNVAADLEAPVSRHFMPFLEFSYSPLRTQAFTYGSNNTGKGLFQSYLADLNGGLKIRFPSRKGDWVPYIGFGAGLLHEWSNTHESGFNTTASFGSSSNELAGNFSVGGIYYITPHVGLNLEAKGYAAQHEHFGRATIGIFYHFQ